MGSTLWARLFPSAYEGWSWLWCLWTHSPFPWVPEAVCCLGKVVWTTGKSLDFPEPSLSICQMKLLLLPFLTASNKAHMRSHLNAPEACNSTALYNYKASSLLFCCMFLASDLPVFHNLNYFKAAFPLMFAYSISFLLPQLTNKLNIDREAKFKSYTYSPSKSLYPL